MGTVIAINGSPRKSWNTATLLEHALKGAESAGAKTGLVHLYDLDYKGCTSCFSCKLKDGKSYGKCAMKDDLTPILERIARADAFILGSPVYIGTATGEMRSFLERLVFPYLVYDRERPTLFPKKIPTAFIHTMGADESSAKMMGFDVPIRLTELVLGRIFGSSETLVATDTLQFDDYAKYVSPAHDLAGNRLALRRRPIVRMAVSHYPDRMLLMWHYHCG